MIFGKQLSLLGCLCVCFIVIMKERGKLADDGTAINIIQRSPNALRLFGDTCVPEEVGDFHNGWAFVVMTRTHAHTRAESICGIVNVQRNSGREPDFFLLGVKYCTFSWYRIGVFVQTWQVHSVTAVFFFCYCIRCLPVDWLHLSDDPYYCSWRKPVKFLEKLPNVCPVF